MNVDQGFQLDLVGALRRRGMLIAGIAGMIFLIGYWVAMALPNEYRSYATLLVEPQAVSGSNANADSGGADLNERLHLMTAQILSRPRLSDIIDKLRLYEDESSYMTREEVIDLMRSKVLVVPILPELEAALRRREIEINTFRVEFTASSARVAADVAQRLANDFIEEHIGARVQVTQKSLDFIVGEQSRIAQQIQEIEAKIAEVKDSNPGSLPEDMAQNQRLIERALSSLRLAQREIDTARSDAAFWASQAADAASGGGVGGSDVSPIHRLQQLELGLDSLRARGFTDKHPDIIVTIQEISEVKESMRAMGESGAGDSEPMNDGQRNALAQERRANNRVEGSRSEVARYQQEIDALTAQIEATPRVAEKLEALFRQHKNLSGNMADFNNRRLDAEVRANLERRQLGEQFRVLEPAFAPDEPASPNRILILIVGLMIGSSLGVASAIVAESADSSVHGPLQLQTDMGIPVLASIPTILLQPDLVARRRRWMRNVAAAMGVTVFMLVGGFVTYLAVNGADAAADAPAVDEDARKRSLDLLREPGSERAKPAKREPEA